MPRPNAGATSRCARSSRTRRRSIARKRRADDAIAWVERGDATAATRSIARRTTLPSSSARRSSHARRASCLPARRSRSHGASASSSARSASTRRKSSIAPSPFDYERQARLFIAPPRLNPKVAGFRAPCGADRRRVSRPLAAAARSCSSRRTRGCAKSTRCCANGLPFPVRLQGELPRAHLLDWFRKTPNAVLFATGTFWEGIDVVGEALSCVIIDRFPFPSPKDPLVMARIRALEARGLDGFEHYMIPAATVRLKQGFGRLIRSTTDRGVVALLDGRAASTRYGATILRACRRLNVSSISTS